MELKKKTFFPTIKLSSLLLLKKYTNQHKYASLFCGAYTEKSSLQLTLRHENTTVPLEIKVPQIGPLNATFKPDGKSIKRKTVS